MVKTEKIDWDYAMTELLEMQGLDLRQEMEAKLLNLEEQFKKEKQKNDRLFEEQRQVGKEKNTYTHIHRHTSRN